VRALIVKYFVLQSLSRGGTAKSLRTFQNALPPCAAPKRTVSLADEDA
jgi:hypothetical protein